MAPPRSATMTGKLSGTLRARAAYEAMDPVVRQRLMAYFAPHNRRLAALLGRDFGWEHE
jgi:hypothetical protein